MTIYHLFIQFELDGGQVRKLHKNQKIVRECYYMNLKSLGGKEEPLLGEKYCQYNVGKEVATEVMVVLSALVE